MYIGVDVTFYGRWLPCGLHCVGLLVVCALGDCGYFEFWVWCLCDFGLVLMGIWFAERILCRFDRLGFNLCGVYCCC